jgi:hypothetical protein
MNIRSEISGHFCGTLRPGCRYISTQMEESIMKKFGFLVAAVIAAGIVAPSMASAETIVIKHRDHGGPRAEMMRHRDHGFRHHDRRVVVIKERHHRH